MSRHRQVISCYLALCLAMAGAVGLNPVLHHWIEHGGHGSTHAHGIGFARTKALSLSHSPGSRPQEGSHARAHHHHHDGKHANGPGHRHDAASPWAPPLDPTAALLTHTHGPFSPPTIPLTRFWQSVIDWLTGTAPDTSEPTPSPDTPDHQHHSLPQSLVGGLVEPSANLPILRFEPGPGFFHPLPAETVVLARDFDPQSASRGPPTARS